LQLTFDNRTKAKMNSDLVREEARLPAVSSTVLFEIFPFIIVFGEDMVSSRRMKDCQLSPPPSSSRSSPSSSSSGRTW
jgi:hypothetical protein